MVIIGLLLLLASPAAAEPPSLGWETNAKHAFAVARDERKMVLIDFWASWCGPCQEMERRTFPDPRVSRELAGFVLLKVDVDHSTIPNLHRVTSYPTYLVEDPWERDRFRFDGFHEPDAFAQKLHLVRAAAPGMIAAGERLTSADDPDAYLLLGRSYLQAKDTSDARDAFEAARKRARRARDGELEQRAEIQIAATWAFERDFQKAIDALEAVTRKPASSECAASAWLTLGHIRRAQGDLAAAARAYDRALAASPPDSEVRKEAEASAAALRK